MTLTSECQGWLKKNPGWHFASDVADGLAAKDTNARRKVAAALSMSAIAKKIERKGLRHNYRYRWAA